MGFRDRKTVAQFCDGEVRLELRERGAIEPGQKLIFAMTAHGALSGKGGSATNSQSPKDA
ncbi:hypothetical protein JQ597_20405 [Bradyrhizobium sp. AUGA SZCCT0177]|uniref:hypothetical protein n=1 Tax=Bradyrhizobium sp. AUGA SZCCT0177 TaxID=2807665 RepID=UPI001BAC4284|nr:hypothetical protein [Bradyrhizobium sp. AUGA SZCCT0177]MBR1284416.1 hypothetical protein [Bradyrhizobium sp. AUGA SZCCT0177]